MMQHMPRFLSRWRGTSGRVAFVVVTLLAIAVAQGFADDPGLGLAYLSAVPVVAAAAFFGRWEALLAAGAAVALFVLVQLLVADERLGPVSFVSATAVRAAVLLGVALVTAELLDREGRLRASMAAAAAEAPMRARVVERAHAMQELTAALSAATTPDQVSEAVAELGKTVVGATAGVVGLTTPDGQALAIHARPGLADARVAGHEVMPLDSPFPMPTSVRTGEPVLVHSYEEFASRFPSEVVDALTGSGRAGAAVPLDEAGGQRPGSVGFIFAEEQAFPPELVDAMVTVARLCSQALERARLYEAERRARTGLLRLQALATGLTASLTPEQVAAVVVGQGVEALGAQAGSLCILDEEDAQLEIIEATGYREELLVRFRRFGLNSGAPSAEAARERRAVWLNTPDEVAARYGVAESDRGPWSSEAFVPLLVGGRVLGVLGMSFDQPRDFEQHDRELLLTLARQAAQALDRSRLYAAEHAVANALQRSLLPARLPLVPGAMLATRYRPGVTALDVGGDWFDAIPLAGDRVGVAVGDVVGRGMGAAATMGQLRIAMHALAPASSGPADLLERLDAFSDDVPGALCATVAYAVIEPASGLMSYACAGHPPPFVAGPSGGTVALSEGRSVPLGVPGGSRPQATTTLVPGATLLLYSDGLVERRAELIDDSLGRLARTLDDLCRLPLDELCDALLDEMLVKEAQHDDVALLCLRLGDPAGRGAARDEAARAD